MIFPQLTRFTDVALLLLRVIVGIVFLTSGWNHLRDPENRSKDIGMSKNFTIFLGAAELAGSLGVIFGVFAQLAAAGLILVMLCAIQRRFSFGALASGGNQGQMGGATTPCSL
jgi:putative oxidoreductase